AQLKQRSRLRQTIAATSRLRYFTRASARESIGVRGFGEHTQLSVQRIEIEAPPAAEQRAAGASAARRSHRQAAARTEACRRHGSGHRIAARRELGANLDAVVDRQIGKAR